MAAGDSTMVFFHRVGKAKEQLYDVTTKNGSPVVLHPWVRRVYSAVASWTQTGTGTESVQCVIDNTTNPGQPTVSVTSSSTGQFTCNVVIKGN